MKKSNQTKDKHTSWEVSKELREGEQIPNGWGVAYRNMEWKDISYIRLSAVIYPIPLNIVIAFFRKIWFWLMWGHKLYETGYEKGYSRGEDEGRKYAFNQYKKQVIAQFTEKVAKDAHKATFSILTSDNLRHPENVEGYLYKFIEKEKQILNAEL